MKNRLSSLFSLSAGLEVTVEDTSGYSKIPGLDVTYRGVRVRMAPSVSGGLFLEVQAPQIGLRCLELSLFRPAKEETAPKHLADGTYYYDTTYKTPTGQVDLNGKIIPGVTHPL